MAAFNFPNSPNTNDVHTENGISFKWDGTVWKRVSGTGAQGATGTTGSQGAAGAQGDNAGLDISTGAPSSPDAGDLWFDSDSGVLAAYYNDGNSSQWVEVSTGPIGAQGAQGNTGAGGATGAQGATAAQGAQGATGSTGSQGATGAGGSTGPSGATGAQGATGSTGSQGATGSTGAQGATGPTGSQGATGSSGSSGSTGAQGAEGNFGGATFYYTFEANTTDANPGAGDLRLDNSTQNAATGIYICDTDEDGTDIASYLQTIDDSTSTIKGHVKITNKLDSSQFLLFTISSLTDNTGYFDITVSPVDSSATSPFSANEDILITFARTGDKGDTGAQGAAGSSGSAGAQGATGATGAQGATGPTGAQGATGSGGSTGPSGATGAQGAAGSSGSATLTNVANNRVMTAVSGTTLNAESNLTFDGTTLGLTGRLEAGSITGPDGSAGNFSIASGHESSPFIFYVGQFGVSAGEKLRITSTGRVGINESTVDTQLHVSGSANAQTTAGAGTNTAIRITDTDTSAQSGQVYGEIQFETRDVTSPGVAAYITAQGNSSGSAALNFGTGSGGSASTKMTIHQTGNASLGYQYTVPNEYTNQTTFTINGNTYGRLDLEVAGTLKGSLWANSGGLGLDAGGNEIEFYAGSAERFRITSAGNVRVLSGVIENAKTIASNYTVSTNFNAMSAGPMSIANGVSVTVPSGSAWTIV